MCSPIHEPNGLVYIAQVEVRIYMSIFFYCYCLHRMNRRRIHRKKRSILRTNSNEIDQNDLIIC